MVHVRYEIKKIRQGIFAVVVPDKYERAMLFLRFQEFYESPNPKFRGKSFDIWEYIEWYSKRNGGSFTYPSDWSGYNIPLPVIRECLNHLEQEKNISPYDRVMIAIIDHIWWMNDKKTSDGYIIGTDSTKGDTFMHEVCHGLYFNNPSYKKAANYLIKNVIDKKHFEIFKKNLLQMGYANKVVKDEVQAYLLFGHDTECFGKGVPIAERKKYHSIFHENLSTIIYEGKQKTTGILSKNNQKGQPGKRTNRHRVC